MTRSETKNAKPRGCVCARVACRARVRVMRSADDVVGRVLSNKREPLYSVADVADTASSGDVKPPACEGLTARSEN